MEVSDKAKLTMSQARVAIQLGNDGNGNHSANMAFFAEFLAIPWSWSPVGTACTDGVCHRYDPSYVEKLTRSQCVDLILEESMHIVLCHAQRCGERDHKVWNIACDMAIFEMLKTIDRVLPDDCHVAGKGEYAGFPKNEIADVYYTLLMKNGAGKKPSGGGSGKSGFGVAVVEKFGSFGEEGKYSPVAATSEEASVSKVAMFVEHAKNEARSRGTVSSAFFGGIKPVECETPDYRVLLRRYMKNVVRGGCDWSRQSSRSIASGYYSPIRRMKAIRDVCVLVDVSGSVDDDVVSQFLCSVDRLLSVAQNRVVVIWHDVNVLRVDEFRAGGMIPPQVRPGNGGTSHIPALRKAAEICSNAGVVVSLTDMASIFPASWDGPPILWVSTFFARTPGYGELCLIS